MRPKVSTRPKIKIAREAGVAEGTIYQYFTNKEDLILAIPTTRIKQYLTKIPGIVRDKEPDSQAASLHQTPFLSVHGRKDLSQGFSARFN